MSAEPLSRTFNEVVHECLKRGELNALDFLWRESGHDPNNGTIELTVFDLTAVAADALCEHCRVHTGLRVKLTPLRVEQAAISPLIGLITQGKVLNLDLNGHALSAESLCRLASVVGQVKHKLTCFSAIFDIHSERALAESLPNDIDAIHVDVILMAAAGNKSLKHLNFIHGGDATLIAYLGHLIYLLQKNQTLTELQLNVCLPIEHMETLAAALGNNTTLTEFSLHPQPNLDGVLANAINDMLARNRALTNDQFLQKAGWAFDPLQRHNGLADVGSVIARHMLQNSSSLEAFADTMAIVELSMEQLAQSIPVNSLFVMLISLFLYESNTYEAYSNLRKVIALMFRKRCIPASAPL